MKEIVKKLVELEQRLSAERGAFSLFALFLREDAPDKWDLVVSAPWLEENREDGLRLLAREVGAVLTPEELLFISRIVLIERNDPGVGAVARAVRIEHGVAEIKDSNFFGLEIKHAFVITSQRQSEPVGPEAR